MIRIFNRLLLTSTFKHSSGFVNFKYLTVDASDKFGTGSKFIGLDSATRKNGIVKKKSSENTIDDPDTFGTITNECNSISFRASVSTISPTPDHVVEDEDEKEYEKVLGHIRLSNDEYKPHSDSYYAKLMRNFAKEGKIKEAISVFYDDMIERDRYKPTLWLYKELMKILAEAGYTHMVFSLWKKLTDSKADNWKKNFDRSYLEKIITVLLKACGTCDYPEFAIRKCDAIRVYLKNRDICPNKYMYGAMINAYGKSGAIYEAFNVVDEMLERSKKLHTDHFGNLLCACLSDKNHGFKYALDVWQMCLKSKTRPSLEMYNMLLQITNECNVYKNGIADPKNLRDIKFMSLKRSTDSVEAKLLEPGSDQIKQDSEMSLVAMERGSSILTVVDRRESDKILEGHIVKAKNDTCMARFDFLGGIEGICRSMAKHDIVPNAKTIDFMLYNVPNGPEPEELLLKLMKTYKINLSIGFINNLIRRRIFRKDFDGADLAYELIQQNKLLPNIHTFNALAYKINNLDLLKKFLADLKDQNIQPPQNMLSALASQSFVYYRPSVLKHLCDYTSRNKIPVDKFFIRKLDTSLDKIKRKIIDYEKNYSRTERESNPYYQRLSNFYNKVMPFYEDWKPSAVLQEEPHPYEKFAREEDKLFKSYVKRTENLKKREEFQ